MVKTILFISLFFFINLMKINPPYIKSDYISNINVIALNMSYNYREYSNLETGISLRRDHQDFNEIYINRRDVNVLFNNNGCDIICLNSKNCEDDSCNVFGNNIILLIISNLPIFIFIIIFKSWKLHKQIWR
jgi:hypothetical protein